MVNTTTAANAVAPDPQTHAVSFRLGPKSRSSADAGLLTEAAGLLADSPVAASTRPLTSARTVAKRKTGRRRTRLAMSRIGVISFHVLPVRAVRLR